jgi:hypothetical protein
MCAALISNWVILVPRGPEYQAVLRGLARRHRPAPTQFWGLQKFMSPQNWGLGGGSFLNNNALNVMAIPAGPAIKPWLTQTFKPEPATQILSLGLCGGLHDRMAVGTVVIYDAPELATPLGLQSVRGLTIDRVLCFVQDKQELAKTADVVDMESQHIVAYGQTVGVQVRVIRVVSDDASGDLPDISGAIDGAGNLSIGALILAFGRNPIGAVRLVRGSLRALKQLESVVAELDFDRLAV